MTTPRTIEALQAMTPTERRQLLHPLEAVRRMPVLHALDY
jgi:hypothetical protein